MRRQTRRRGLRSRIPTSVARPQVTIREATPEDHAIILHHRRSMFRDMGDGTLPELDRTAELTGPWLKQSLADGSYRGWLAADHAGRVIAGGGVLLSSWPASPNDPLLRRAMILNVYTEPEFRQRGLARLVLETILDWLRQQGFHSVSLHASDAGRPIYEKLGFRPTNEMRLRFDVGEQKP